MMHKVKRHNIGKESLHVPITRSINNLVEDSLILEQTKELMALSIFDSPESALERDTEEFIKEEEDSEETFKLPELEKSSRPPIELKPLTSGLRYAFLNGDVEPPLIMSIKPSEEEIAQVITILEKHRPILGYAIQDLKGTSHALCTHRIPLDLDKTPSREPQQRLNNAMREVVKKEVLKLLHAGIIYLIPHSERESLVQVVPKEGGMTVVENNKNKLVAQRIIMG